MNADHLDYLDFSVVRLAEPRRSSYYYDVASPWTRLGYVVIPGCSATDKRPAVGGWGTTGRGLGWAEVRGGDSHREVYDDVCVTHCDEDRCGLLLLASGTPPLVVIDVDDPRWTPWVIDTFGPTPLTVSTGREGGGIHLYYRMPPASWLGDLTGIRNLHRCIGPDAAADADGKTGIDVKAAGGYVICPGSRHKSGATYTASAPITAELIAELPILDWEVWQRELSIGRARSSRQPTSVVVINGPRPATVTNVGDDLPHDVVVVDLHGRTFSPTATMSVGDRVNCYVPWRADRHPSGWCGVQDVGPRAGRVWIRDRGRETRWVEGWCDSYLSQHPELRTGATAPELDLGELFGGGDEASANSDAPTRTTILVDDRVDTTTRATLDALRTLPDLYLRGGVLVERTGSSTRPIRAGRLRELMSSASDFVRIGPKQRVIATPPPGAVIDAILARPLDGEFGRIDHVVDAPVLLADGTVSVPGYCDGVLHMPDGPSVSVPGAPNREEAAHAAATLLDLVTDFPFADDAARSAWIAALLTPLARAAIDGPCPIFPITGNVRGAGKGLLTSIIASVVDGETQMRLMTYGDDTEVEKRITATLMTSPRLVLIDNIDRKFGGAALDALATAPREWTGRVLGQSSMVSLPSTAVWYATGNNLAYAGDMVRRVCPVRLESSEEHPEDRSGFRHEDVVAYALKHRAELLSAALTILRAGIVADRKPQLRAWGSYGAWSRVVRSAIVHAGLADPIAARDEARAGDDSARKISTLMSVLIDHPDKTAAELAGEAKRRDGDAELANNLAEVCPHGVTAASVGVALRGARGRVVGGRRIVAVDGHARQRRWRVEDLAGELVASFSVASSSNVVPLVRAPAHDVDELLSSLMDD